jgi:hypothetical protein
MRQGELSSRVFDQTDYSQFAPASKRDLAQPKEEIRSPPKPNKKALNPDLAYANEVWTQNLNPQRRNPDSLDPKQMAQQQLGSSLGPQHPVSQKREDPDEYKQKLQASVPGKSAAASTHQKVLSSNIGGHDALKYYEQKFDLKGKEVVDLDLRGLPESCDEQWIKRAAGVRHVVAADLVYDNFRGTCKGTGRLRVRLNEGESVDTIQASLQRHGIQVSVHQDDPRKRALITAEPKTASNFAGNHRD